ncbi:MAG: hypothetical protein ACLFQ6_12270, partial [Candidatus Sumerlaeia bacterium]
MWALPTTQFAEFQKGLQVRSQPREGRRVECNPFIILGNFAPDDGPYGPYYKRSAQVRQGVVAVAELLGVH